MISRSDITAVGCLIKPHGIKGEILASLDYDIDLAGVRCVILEIDGIFVPFFVDGIRPKSTSSVLVHIEDISSEKQAKSVCGKDIYVLNADLPESSLDEDGGFYISDMIGFTIQNPNNETVGEIVDFDDSTENPLFMVRPVSGGENEIVYIPIAEDFIEAVDVENRIMTMDLPSGLLELNT